MKLAGQLLIPLVSLRASASDLYDKIYPMSGEFCAMTQIQKKPGFGALVVGGKFGHSVMYLTGICRDQQSAFPQIKICDPADGPENGVGISVSSDFKNINWVAVDDKNFFFHGLAQPGQILDQNIYLQTKATARQLGILSAVKIHEELYANSPRGMERDDFKYEDSYGTDYAISNGRSMSCVRFPLDKSQLEKIVQNLNSLNQYYFQHENYVWEVSNNCATTLDNALAAAGFWNALPVSVAPYGFGDVAIPMNSYARLMSRVSDLPLESLADLYQDSAARKSLIENGTLPTRAGGLAEEFSIAMPNQVFETNVVGTAIDLPIFNPVHNRMETYLKEARYRDLKTNLTYFLARFQKLKEKKRPWWVYRPPTSLKQPGGPRPFNAQTFQKFYARFYEFVDRQIAETGEKLKLLEQQQP